MKKPTLSDTNEPTLFLSALPRALPEAHKYAHGHAVIFSGGLESLGAARLAARAALRVGAGLVTLAVPASALLAHASRGPDALMVRLCNNCDEISKIMADPRGNAAAIGPAFGIGEITRDAVRVLMSGTTHMVLDADALTSFSGHLAILQNIINKTRLIPVLTPHEGEFQKLFGTDIDSKMARLERAHAAATLLGAIIILKGAETIIAAPDGRVAVNRNAPPWLATAGSGDVLTGMVTGLLARNMPPYEAACAAVWLHGAAGQMVGRGLIADDLPEAIGRLRAASDPLREAG
jgi:ADP-dependent NAD(P)H-hydrate dehydratase / NAD(P)H-hydrate epimerase